MTAAPQRTHPRVSIVLPTCDGEDDLRHLLPALAAQDFTGGTELLAIDSDSRDGTRELLAAAGADVERIPRAEFRHGASRNRCAARAAGEILVFLSQDAVPADERWLSALVAPFDSDERLAGTYSRVLPHPEDDPLAARTVLDLPEASEEPFVRDLDRVGPVWTLAPEERGRYLRFNNVASAVRAEVFHRIPFPETTFAEDFAWAARVLTAGHRLAFVPGSVVHHAHRYGLRAAYERYRVDAEFHEQAHGWRIRPSAASALRGFLYEVRRDLSFLAERPAAGLRHALRSPGLRAAQVLGQYVGSRGRGPRVWRGDLVEAES